ISLAARIVREVGDLLRRARAADRSLATLSIDAEVRFRSPAERAAFSRELTESVTRLVAHYHDEAAPGGRPHRLVVVAHPPPSECQDPSDHPGSSESPTTSQPITSQHEE